jgi:tetratricopeptide (TPR) repeat protein
MDKRLYAVVAVGVLFSGAAHALDCQQSPMELRDECKQEERQAEIDRSSIKFACTKLKQAFDQGNTTDANAEVLATLRKCEKDGFLAVNKATIPAPAPASTSSSAHERGLAALNEGDFDAAIAEFTATINKDPRNTFSYIRRAEAYEKKGDAASAIADYRIVLRLVDDETGAQFAAKIRKLEKTKK